MKVISQEKLNRTIDIDKRIGKTLPKTQAHPETKQTMRLKMNEIRPEIQIQVQ